MSKLLKTLNRRIEKLEEAFKPKPRYIPVLYSLSSEVCREEVIRKTASEQGIDEIRDDDCVVIIHIS